MIDLLKRCCVVTLLLHTLMGNAQTAPGSTKVQKEKFRPGFALGGGGNFYLPNSDYLDDVSLFFNPSFTLQKPKYVLSIGAMAGARRTNSHSYNHWGGEFMYQYYPNTNANTFNLYFFVAPALSFYSQTYTDGYYNYYQGYVSQTYTNSISLLKMGGGYGVRINMAKWAYLYQHNEIGFAYNLSSSTNSPYYYYNPYSKKNSFGFVQVSLGLGFVF